MKFENLKRKLEEKYAAGNYFIQSDDEHISIMHMDKALKHVLNIYSPVTKRKNNMVICMFGDLMDLYEWDINRLIKFFDNLTFFGGIWNWSEKQRKEMNIL